jgi:hypothetical protein
VTTIWFYRAYESGSDVPDVKGWDVDASDGHIGKVDEATYDVGSGCLVVDTGFWIFGKKRMIPAGLIDTIDLDDEKIYLAATKDEVKSAPDYDEMTRDDEQYRKGVGDYWASRS